MIFPGMNIQFIYPFISWAWGCFCLGIFMKNAIRSICVQVFVWTYVFASLGGIPRNGITESCTNQHLVFWGTATVFQSGCPVLYSHQRSVGLPCFILWPMWIVMCLFYYCHAGGYEVVFLALKIPLFLSFFHLSNTFCLPVLISYCYCLISGRIYQWIINSMRTRIFVLFSNRVLKQIE